ncbi:MAG: STAS domain-containing protein [Kutzneria sp.]|nr:STAS domain-containing protein [Kutzneria sp.]MBV9844244.1 STAS domain-containing protein [Kutzneria sp.]
MADDLARAAETLSTRTELVTVGVEHHRDGVIVHVAGEVDMASAPAVSQTFDRVISADPGAVVLDLTQVDFLSSSGLQMLTDMRQDASTNHVPLWLVAQGRAVLRPMEITGILDGFSVLPSVAAALATVADIPAQVGDTWPESGDRETLSGTNPESKVRP